VHGDLTRQAELIEFEVDRAGGQRIDGNGGRDIALLVEHVGSTGWVRDCGQWLLSQALIPRWDIDVG